MSEENIINNNFIFSDSEMSSVETLAYDYDYRSYLQTIINNQNKIIDNQDKTFEMINGFNTYMIFFLAIVLVYQLFKNFIRK